MLSRFHLIPERHGQTDGQTDGRTYRIAISISRVSVLMRNKKLTRPWKLHGPWTTTWSKQYISVVHRVTCSLL